MNNRTFEYKIKLSPYHKIFYNEWKLDPYSSKYNIVFDQTLSNNLDINRLRNALDRFIANYLLFNSHIIEINDEPYWIGNSSRYQLEYFENSNESKDIFEYIVKPFALDNGVLYRFAVFNDSNANYRFIIVLHHILIDGPSVDILIKEISCYYNCSTYTSSFSLITQQNTLEVCNNIFLNNLVDNKELYRTFWRNLLQEIEPLDLNFLKLNSGTNNSSFPKTDFIEELRFSIEEKDLLLLQQICRKLLITPYMYGKCVFAVVLQLYADQDKFAISYPVLIKTGQRLICGANINTNLQVFEFTSKTTILDLFNQNRNFIKSLKHNGSNYSNYPIEYITEYANKELLNIMFADTNLKDTKFDFNEVSTIKINHEFNIDVVSKLFFEQENKNNVLNYRVRYNKYVTNTIIIENFVDYYKKIFLEVLYDLSNNVYNKPIQHYQKLSYNDYKRVTCEFNQTKAFYPSNKSIHKLFEEQVNLTPKNLALIFEKTKLTYYELNIKANQLAHYLLTNHSIKPETPIALFLDRNQDIIISILAILKSGGAYVPIDTSFPFERIKYILKDISAKFIITHNSVADKINNLQIDTLILDKKNIKKLLEEQQENNPTLNINSNSLAYIIYTSGTTGKPKGVMVEHKQVINTIFSLFPIYNSSNILKIAAFCNYTFDVSVAEFLVSLLQGHELHILSNQVRQDINLISKYIKDNNIDYIYLPPVILSHLPHIKYASLKGIIYAGEPCDYQTALFWSTNNKLYNYYGPTEATIYATGLQIENGNSNLIGKPLNNVQAYILNKNLKLMPIGAIGELYLAGDSIARGYLNNIELTEKKFVKNPFYEETLNNNRMYATGDLVRWDEKGNIEYISRADSQIKIRGYRIELNEVTKKICCYTGVKQAIVILNKNEDSKYRSLIAYYLSEEKLEELLILRYLRNHLPDYMIPNVLIHIDKIPYNLSGKIDFKSLPDPSLIEKDEPKVFTSNDIQLTICRIFSEVLRLPLQKISIYDDFFKLGGNSILAISLVTRLQSYFVISINDIFTFRTPEKISQNAFYIKDNLYNKLEKYKNLYKDLEEYNLQDKIYKDKNRLEYLDKYKNINFNLKEKNINNILLTGSTGYLGCNILYQLLFNTKYKIYLLIRASSDKQAKERIYDKFKFYFKDDLTRFKDRLYIFSSDIEQADLGLDKDLLKNLVQNIDSVIHSAALIKHYGSYNDFYKANVQTTINLLEFAKLTCKKDFHYISTISVLMDGFVPNKKYYIFHEDSDSDILQNRNNFYIQTKYLGELEVIKFRKYGVKSNIFRVGNLFIHSTNYKNPEDFNHRSFFIKIKTILSLKVIPREFFEMEISPVDLTALAIVKLFNKIELSNNTYHIFNPNVSNLYNLLQAYPEVKIKEVSFDSFINIILDQLKNNPDSKDIELFLLHQLALQYIDLEHYTINMVLQNKTEAILSKLNFKWSPITSKMLKDTVAQSLEGINYGKTN